MFQISSHERRGVILLVVIVLLTLFAVLGIAFVYYAEAQADASSAYRDAQSVAVTPVADAPPSQLLDEFLRQFIYDVPDDATGVSSALRGHSLARTIYGWNPYIPTHNDTAYSGVGRLHTSNAGGLNACSNANSADDTQLINYMWFRDLDGTGTAPAQYGFIRDPEHLPPYPSLTPPANMRINPGAYYDPSSTNPAAGTYQTDYHTYVGANASYTYPDLNSAFLAAVKADGTVMMPSYWRETTNFSTSGNGCDPNNAKWTTPGDILTNPGNSHLKYRTLRPRPIDQLLSTETWQPGTGPYDASSTSPRSAQVGFFSIPGDQLDTLAGDNGGDVKNLVGVTGYGGGTNDSIWLDLGSPIRKLADGTMYKPLYAPLIIDLDNRLNVNVHGNVANMRNSSTTPATAAHFSNQGWGPWEVSLSKLLNGTNPPPYEWTNLFLGNSSGTIDGRYGAYAPANNFPPPGATGALMPFLGTRPHFYGQIDYDGIDLSTSAPPTSLSATIGDASGSNPWPTYGSNPGGYDNAQQSPVNELTAHPGLFSFYNPAQGNTPAQRNRIFDVSNTKALIHNLSTTYEVKNSVLGRLLQSSISMQPNARMWLTTHSFDVDQPGVTPWLSMDNGSGSQNYSVPPANTPPSGPQDGFPGIAKRIQMPTGSGVDWTKDNGEFRFADWRAIGAALGKVDLNRQLPPYPSYGATPLTPNYYDRYDDNSKTNVVQAFLNAQAARQELAQDIYTRLLYVTIGRTTNPAYTDPSFPADPTQPAPAPGNMAALRWLAQLAVNIVDYIDEDDISTPFNFYNDGNTAHSQWVFGTELPHVVINEAMAERTGTGPYNHQVYVELHNPLATTGPNLQATDTNQICLVTQPVSASANNDPDPNLTTPTNILKNAYPVYRIALAYPGAAPPLEPKPYTPGNSTYLNDNVAGALDASIATFRKATQIWDTQAGGNGFGSLTDLKTVDINTNPGGAAYTPPANPPAPFIAPQTYFLAGPKNAPGPNTADTVITTSAPASVPANTLWYQSADLQYTQASPDPSVAVVLRRLANPHIPYDPNPNYTSGPLVNQVNPWYNPYITVDYMQSVTVWDRNAGGSSQSFGKKQPYAASQIDTGQNSVSVASTHTSFGRGNDNLIPFNWLVHLDRNLVSPMEILQVCGYQPWQLTQQFQLSGAVTGHRAPWFDEDLSTTPTNSHRLYRLFELLKTGALAADVEGTGRIPGKVNLNTVLDHQIFESICDQNSSNNFATTDVYTGTPSPAGVWDTLLAQRDAGSLASAAAKPFWGLASGSIPSTDPQFGGLSIDSTLLGSITTPGVPGQPTPGQPRVLQATSLASGNPYFYDQIMSKIANQVTNRSHVFAVYLTVGFFRVLSDPNLPAGTLPVKLAGEIGARNTPPTNIRHHLFAIVDRSAITQLRISPQFQAVTTTSSDITFQSPIGPGPLSQPLTQTVQVGALSSASPVTPPVWSIQVGTRVQVGSETVTVTGVNQLAGATSFTANFKSQHPSGTQVLVPVETGQTTSTTAIGPATDPAGFPTAPGTTTVTVGAMTGQVNGQTWSIQPGMQLFVDVYPYQEVVTVSSIDTNKFTANFARTHLGSPPLQIFVPVPNTTSKYDTQGGEVYPMYVNALSDGSNGPVAWQIKPGSIVTVDSGANQETVQVIATEPTTGFFTAYFNKAHSGGVGVYVPKFANPGPQPNFSAKDNSAVVLYAAVID